MTAVSMRRQDCYRLDTPTDYPKRIAKAARLKPLFVSKVSIRLFADVCAPSSKAFGERKFVSSMSYRSLKPLTPFKHYRSTCCASPYAWQIRQLKNYIEAANEKSRGFSSFLHSDPPLRLQTRPQFHGMSDRTPFYNS